MVSKKASRGDERSVDERGGAVRGVPFRPAPRDRKSVERRQQHDRRVIPGRSSQPRAKPASARSRRFGWRRALAQSSRQTVVQSPAGTSTVQ